MTQKSEVESTKKKLQKYGVLVGYSIMGMIGLGFFTFKLIMTRQDNMQKFKQKSKIPVMHKNMKKLAIGGLFGICVYTYGLYQIMRRVPVSQTNIEMGDYSQLSDVNKKNLQMQDHYILKTMKLFGVSEHLVEKTRRQFREMSIPQQIKKQANGKSLNSQLFQAVLERKKIQNEYKNAGNGGKN